MKIDVVGCMCTWYKQLSTSFIIDDEIMFDVPQASFKVLLNDYDILKTKAIIISHFHSDHFADIHLVIDYIYHHRDDKFTIIAPRGCRERLSSMFKIFEIGYLEDALVNRINFIECQNNKIVNFDGYKIKMYKMEHIGLDCYGFTIEKDGVKVGFTGDSAMCNNVHKILAKSNAAFVDTAQDHVTNKHLCADEVRNLIELYPNCKVYPVHLANNSKKLLDEYGIIYPQQGDVITITD